jgi:hypothetical protein
MSTLHEKCPHCRGVVHRFGGRRRRCSRCGKSWSIHARRRGRRSHRLSPSLLAKVLLDTQPARLLALRYHCSQAAIQKRCRREMTRLLLRPPCQSSSDGELVLILDGLRFRFRRRDWTLYDVAVKPLSRNTASFLDPVLQPGRESAERWRDALARIAPGVRKRVRAVVSDGFRGADAICLENGWIHQRCHFHMLAQFTGSHNRKRRVRTRTKRSRDRVYRAVCTALQTTDDRELERTFQVLRQLVEKLPRRRRWRGIVRQFLADIDDFRAYLLHPELHLPRTTSVMESMHSLMRIALSRINSPHAVRRRAACLVRLHPTMTCNGAHCQQ